MVEKALLPILFFFYDLAWRVGISILRRNARLADGFQERLLETPMQQADLWIQAVSGGEAYLAVSILENLKPSSPINILVTTTTRQGLDILTPAADSINRSRNDLQIRCVFFPFDRPKIMNRAVRSIQPKLVILLESEIWPGLFYALKKNRVKFAIINGRINADSAKRFMFTRPIWRALYPDKILSISPLDADRFAPIFDRTEVGIMPNIKFDQIDFNRKRQDKDHPMAQLIGTEIPMVVLGSVRREEEPEILKIIEALCTGFEKVVLGLFPRHMERVSHWKESLTAQKIAWVLRSEAKPPLAPGTVIIWDTFGELITAYGLSCAAFVGGSLAPVGGQNFLEPLAYGIRPVIGPHWHNFSWVGKEIIDTGLVQQAADRQGVANLLVANLRQPYDREDVRVQALKYFKSRQGGTLLACRTIEGYLG